MAHQNGLEAKLALRGKPKANATGVHFFGYFLCASKDKIAGSDFEFANANPKGERHGWCS